MRQNIIAIILFNLSVFKLVILVLFRPYHKERVQYFVFLLVVIEAWINFLLAFQEVYPVPEFDFILLQSFLASPIIIAIISYIKFNQNLKSLLNLHKLKLTPYLTYLKLRQYLEIFQNEYNTDSLVGIKSLMLKHLRKCKRKEECPLGEQLKFILFGTPRIKINSDNILKSHDSKASKISEGSFKSNNPRTSKSKGNIIELKRIWGMYITMKFKKLLLIFQDDCFLNLAYSCFLSEFVEDNIKALQIVIAIKHRSPSFFNKYLSFKYKYNNPENYLLI